MTFGNLQSELVSLLPRLRRFALGLTGGSELADDLVQTGCLKALERADQWQPGTSLASWMYRILQTTWIDQQRILKRRNTAADTEAVERHVGEDGVRIHEAQDELRTVDRLIRELPEEQRAVLLIVSVEGLTYKEAAAVLDVPVGTVMSRLARARGKIADALQADKEVA